MPRYYPAFLNLTGRPCVVIGGRNLEELEQKVHRLLECEAQVTVISPQIPPGVEELAREGRLTWVPRGYMPGDLDGAMLAIAVTTEDRDLSRRIAQEARERNVLLNVVDITDLCSFIAPAVVQRGDVTVAISTAGTSPALARHFREELARSRVMEYADIGPLLKEARARLRAQGLRINSDHWQASITEELIALVQQGRQEEAMDRLMEDLLKARTCDCPDGVCMMYLERRQVSA